MVLSATQKTAFMEDGAHMDIPHDMVSQLQKKGSSSFLTLLTLTSTRLRRLIIIYISQRKGLMILTQELLQEKKILHLL